MGGLTRERMLRELTEAVETLTIERSLILVLEDLHWSDASTLEWLAYVARRRQRAGLLVLGTYRLADATLTAHPVRTLAHDLRLHGQGTNLVLDYLSESEVEAYLKQRFNGTLPPDGVPHTLCQRTNGNPLFLVNMIDDLIRQGAVWESPMGWQWREDVNVVEMEVPMSLRRLIEHQLEQLPPGDQTLLEAASVAGMEFVSAAVAAGLDSTAEAIEVQLDALARRGQFVKLGGTVEWPDGAVTTRYDFIHALYQELLYNRVSASRRVRLHQQIGIRIEAGYSPQTREVAAELAYHFRQGRDGRRAVAYLRQAAENAIRRHAHQEAIDHLTSALETVATLPELSDRIQHELAIYVALAPALRVVKGSSALETEQAYARARELCEQEEDVPQLLIMLEGLCSCYVVRGKYLKAREIGERSLSCSSHAGSSPTFRGLSVPGHDLAVYGRARLSPHSPGGRHSEL
ncbi:MAG: hypothetical protein OEU26_15395 [Candidatus Tectomicrobia bacterium]|nr:hypothetical protein [Candidatus Tectomicrobia bacterium]